MQEILVMMSHTSARTDCWGGGGEAGQPMGTGVFRQFSLAGSIAFGNLRFSGRKSYE